MDGFAGKVAVVTGGASGIGRGIALALVKEGARVVVADVDEASARGTARDLGGGCLAVRTDVREAGSADALLDATRRAFGGVDLFFNNAGVYLGGFMQEATEDDWRFVLDVNLDGVFRMGQAFARALREQGRGGHIVNTASVGGFLSFGGGVAYCVSKYGVVAYSEAQRRDLEPLGIGVSLLCPGPIDTNLPGSDRLRGASEKTGGSSEALRPLIEGGMAPEEVGPIVLRGIEKNLPYIFTHDMRDVFRERFDAILSGFDEVPKGG